jgi:hypothetical protein
VTTCAKADASTSEPTTVESMVSVRPMAAGADESAMAGVAVIVAGKIAGRSLRA